MGRRCQGPGEQPPFSQGTTCAANCRVTAIFSSSGRARSVVPTTVSRLRSMSRQVEGRRAAAEQADQDHPARSGQRREVAREHPRSDQVEHHVNPRAGRVVGDDRGEVLLRGVDRRRRAQRPGPLELVGRPRGAEDRAAHRVGKLAAAVPTPLPTAWIKTRSPGRAAPGCSGRRAR